MGNVEFKLYEDDKKTEVKVVKTGDGTYSPSASGSDTMTTNGSGIAYITDLSVGTYYYQETKSLDGYEFDSSLHAVEIKNTGTTSVTVKNNPQMGNIELIKVDESDNPLDRVTFELYTDEACTVPAKDFYGNSVQSVTTTSNGKVDFELLRYGTYYIKETETHINKKLHLSPIKAVVSENGTTLTFDGKELNKLDGEYKLVNEPITASTELYESTTKLHYVNNKSGVLLSDRVSYSGLTPGREYSIRGQLIDAETGEIAVDDNGTAITSERSFTPKEQDGEVVVSYQFDAKTLGGKKLVAYETITYNGDDVVSHKDINDEKQTVNVVEPSLSTVAKDSVTGINEAYVSDKTTIIDTVNYNGLIPGQKYTFSTKLMDVETGEKVASADATIFTPKTSRGTINIEIPFDSSNYAGKSVVVYESLIYNGTVVARHEDISDSGQTVTFRNPTVYTTANIASPKGQTGYATKSVNIIDQVGMTGILANEEYTLKGYLVDKATGEKLIVDGKPVTAEKTFTGEAETDEYSTAVRFSLDASALKGKQVVVFEELYYKDRLIASHSDITDEEQTVEFANPSISTTAKDSVTQTNEAYVSKNTTIIDTVAYTGLIPNVSCQLEAKLIDKETGKQIGTTAKKTFTPTAADGKVDVEINLDSSDFAGKQVVVFEDLKFINNVIATHSDITDKKQTISFKNPSVGTTAIDKETGKHEGYASDKTTIVDTVKMDGLIAGKQYKLSGVLMDKSTGEEFIVNDKNVTAEKTFTATAEEMSIDMDFTFDSSALGDITVVAFESLEYNDIEIAYHKDIDDDEQTVTVHGKGDIRFIKTDESGAPMSGVKFNIYTDADCTIPATKADGSKIDSVTTDKDGVVEYTNMLYGTYYIAETQTVNGKQFLTDTITAVISKDGTVLTYSSSGKVLNSNSDGEAIVNNNDIPNLPNTGGVGIWVTTAIGLILLATAGAVMFFKRKTKKDGAEL